MWFVLIESPLYLDCNGHSDSGDPVDVDVLLSAGLYWKSASDLM